MRCGSLRQISVARKGLPLLAVVQSSEARVVQVGVGEELLVVVLVRGNEICVVPCGGILLQSLDAIFSHEDVGCIGHVYARGLKSSAV